MPQATTQVIPKRDHKPQRKMKQADIEKALTLRTENNLSYDQIAAVMDETKQRIWRNIKDLEPDRDTETFKLNRADILAKMQLRIFTSVTDDDIKKAPFGSRILAAAQLYDKERLERGQSTDNVAVIGVIKQLQAMHRGQELSTGSDNLPNSEKGE